MMAGLVLERLPLRKTMVGYAQMLQALSTVAGLLIIGIAAWGSFRWRALQEFEKLAEARAQRIGALEKDLEFMKARIETLEALVSKLQRDEVNWKTTELELRRELDQLRARRRKVIHEQAEGRD